jgi:hypothetical protein
MMAAAPLWGVTTSALRSNSLDDPYGDNNCSSPVERLSWSQICQRWTINIIISVIVLTLLTLFVTYFGHTFSLENNRTYFIILLLSLFAITIAISLLFCKNRKKPQRKKTNETVANEQQGVVDINTGENVSAINFSVDL